MGKFKFKTPPLGRTDGPKAQLAALGDALQNNRDEMAKLFELVDGYHMLTVASEVVERDPDGGITGIRVTFAEGSWLWWMADYGDCPAIGETVTLHVSYGEVKRLREFHA